MGDTSWESFLEKKDEFIEDLKKDIQWEYDWGDNSNKKKKISMILVGEMKIIQIPIKIIIKKMMAGIMNGVQTIKKKKLILMIIMKKNGNNIRK